MFANVFSQSIDCLFILFMTFFAVQKLISLIRFHLFIFVFIFLPCKTDLRKYWYNLCQRMFLLCSLLGVLWCLVLYLLSLKVTFEFISVYGGLRAYSSFTDFHASVQLSQHYPLKTLSPHSVFLPPSLKINCHRCVGLFLGSLFCSHDPCVCFCANTMLF